MKYALLLAGALLLFAASTVGIVLGLQQRVTAGVGTPLAWSPTPPDDFTDVTALDAGTRTLVLGHDGNTPPGPTLRADGRWLVLPSDFEGHDYDGAAVDGPRVVLVFESVVEGPGPSLEVLESRDGAQSFTLLASVPKPSFSATFERVRVADGELALEVLLDGDGFLAQAWWSPWHSLLARVVPRYAPMVPAGTWVMRSRDSGRTFTLHRR